MAENLLHRRDEDDDDAGLRPLRKIRAISGYNLWHAEFMKTAGIYSYVFTIYCVIIRTMQLQVTIVQ